MACNKVIWLTNCVYCTLKNPAKKITSTVKYPVGYRFELARYSRIVGSGKSSASLKFKSTNTKQIFRFCQMYLKAKGFLYIPVDCAFERQFSVSVTDKVCRSSGTWCKLIYCQKKWCKVECFDTTRKFVLLGYASLSQAV